MPIQRVVYGRRVEKAGCVTNASWALTSASLQEADRLELHILRQEVLHPKAITQ